MDKFTSDIQPIESVIESLIDDSEKVYGFISDQLPILESQAEASIRKSQRLLEKFYDPKGESETFITLVESLDQEMNNIYEDLISQQDISEILKQVNEDNDEGSNFKKLLLMIDELTSVFKSLEQLSINAIIFSSRLEEGAAFRVISQEINILSKQVESDYKDFSENIKVLKEWNETFTKYLENLSVTEKSIFSQYNGDFKDAIYSIIESLEGISKLIDDFIIQVQGSLEPISKIMVELQGQDLIRQNMENLNEIFTSLQLSVETFNTEELESHEALDTLQFIIDIGELSRRLLFNIEDQFTLSINNILEFTEEMDEILEIINDDGKTLWDFMVNGIQTGNVISSSVDKKNDEVFEQVNDFQRKMTSITKGYKKLDDCDTVLDNNLIKIKENFNDIGIMANRFKRIKILAKMEFARLNQQDLGHITNIEKVIDVFIEFSSENEAAFKNIENTLVQDIQEFSQLRDTITDDLSHAIDELKQSKIALSDIKSSVKDAISDLIDITGTLYNNVHQIIADFKDFGDMSENINYIDSSINALVQEAKAIKNNILEENEIDEWTSTNDYYKSIEDKFTSYIERKTASETFGHESIDTGSEGGELTFF